jgi:hypothetical protein
MFSAVRHETTRNIMTRMATNLFTNGNELNNKYTEFICCYSFIIRCNSCICGKLDKDFMIKYILKNKPKWRRINTLMATNLIKDTNTN